MTDVVDKTTRSRMMSRIRGKHTKPELLLRRFLHHRGYRFRLHRNDLPGAPDLVLPRYSLAIFVNGCFWHRHSSCFYATTPSTRVAFWQEKFSINVERDRRNHKDLMYLDWRVLVVWECGFKHSSDRFTEIPVLIEGVNQYQEWPAVPPRTCR
ncbi:very short patch repair endonuclease [Halomonas organivorans]|uniref:Very short patch repair endonuclease n=1 Tax=Halomonas organivorans TaxID=257772 RepID=A0A7W5BUH0_9GAMM|nr:DNA mismatch endonuclease Vsr [Halomonas organivorans]MBB3139261.1 DNA mismatch endonuclease (patch repair protein) [Halomonas organivorans]